VTVMTDRIEMTEPDELTLDKLFERLERMPVPEGYKVEIVEGSVHMSPQRWTHWETIRWVVRQLEDHLGMGIVTGSDVRIDFPGHLNGFAPDLVKITDGAARDSRGLFSPHDVEFVMEVISKATAANDYGPKKSVYASSSVPAYLIVDPYVGRCRLFTHPKDGDYGRDLTVDFGEEIDLSDTPVGITLSTENFPRD
jgi:Uma2 family endonuclease